MDSKQKKRREDTIRYIGKWFYEAEIPFNTPTFPPFQQMLIAIERFNEILRAPSSYELSETILEREVETQESLTPYKESCIVSRCTLMIDTFLDVLCRTHGEFNVRGHCQE